MLVTAELQTLRDAFDMLQREVCKVLTCTNLKTADCVLRAASPRIAVVDYHMPGGKVARFLQAAKRAHPNIRFIVLAESASVSVAARATRDLRARVVAKPLDATIFSAVVRACRKAVAKHQELTRARSARSRGRGTTGPA